MLRAAGSGLLFACHLVAEPLTGEQRLRLLHALYEGLFDRGAGQRLQAEMQRRMRPTPIAQQQGLLIADHFRPLGYHTLAARLKPALVNMEESLQAYLDGGSLDTYQRADHILQLAAAPGLGKSTASRLVWVALHQELMQRPPGSLSALDVVLQQRVANSITPNNLLLFQLDLSEGKRPCHQPAHVCTMCAL